jgi:hypothetical protein
VNEGQQAKFSLTISGKPKPSVKWFREEEEIVITEEEYEIIETEDSVQFIIKSAKPVNTGSYYVELTNDAGKITSNKAQLIVNSMYK